MIRSVRDETDSYTDIPMQFPEGNLILENGGVFDTAICTDDWKK